MMNTIKISLSISNYTLLVDPNGEHYLTKFYFSSQYILEKVWADARNFEKNFEKIVGFE